jgi:uncharacterized phage protein (TIGR01671 family)
MRDIKFRAWDERSKQMESWGNLVGYCDLSYLTEYQDGDDDLYHVIPMQFTGLTDKNGVDIYEGDVVSDNDGLHFTANIGGYFSKESVGNGAHYYPIGEDSYWAIEANPFDKEANLKVIGNIYENPELLKDES